MKNKLYIIFALLISVLLINTVKAESLLEAEKTYTIGEYISEYRDMLSLNGNYYVLEYLYTGATRIVIPQEEFTNHISKEFTNLTNSSFIKYNNNILLVGIEKNALKLYVVDENLQVTNQKETSYLIDLDATIKTYLYDNKVYLMLFENDTMQSSTIYEIDSELNVTENNLSSYDSELLKKVLKGDYYIIRMNDEEKDGRITHYNDTAYNKDFSVLVGNTSNITYDELMGYEYKSYLTIIDHTTTEPLNFEHEEYTEYLDVEIIKNKIVILATDYEKDSLLIYDKTGKLEETITLPNTYEEMVIRNYSLNKISNKLMVYSKELVRADIQEKLFSFYNFDLSIIANESLYGTIDVVDTALSGTEVVMTITPNTGYEIDKIEIIDSLGNIIIPIDNKFIMPEDDVYITVNYKATIDNPETNDVILLVSAITLFVILGTTVLTKKLKWLK